MTPMDSRKVVIDDTDRRILYTGSGWHTDSSGSQDGVGNFGPTYQHTLHGTQVDVIGTNHIKNTSGVYDPTWECFVDNVSIGANPYKYPENNWKLCSTGELKDGPHVLTVNVTTAGQMFWFDSIRYLPSHNFSLDSGAVLRIDSTDPEISYDSGWRVLEDVNSGNTTQMFGSTVSFSFIGTGLSWMGFISTKLPRNLSQGTYSIDEGPQVPFPLNGLSPSKNTQHNQVFFSTGELPAGPHTLRATYQGNDSLTPLTLDYLYVRTSSFPMNTTSNAKTSTHTQPVWAIIVESAVGGITFIVLTLVLFFWYRRKHDHPWRSDMETSVTPFLYNGSQPARAGYNPIIDISQMRETVIRPDLARLSLHKSSISRPLQEDAPPRYTAIIE